MKKQHLRMAAIVLAAGLVLQSAPIITGSTVDMVMAADTLSDITKKRDDLNGRIQALQAVLNQLKGEELVKLEE